MDRLELMSLQEPSQRGLSQYSILTGQERLQAAWSAGPLPPDLTDLELTDSTDLTLGEQIAAGKPGTTVRAAYFTSQDRPAEPLVIKLSQLMAGVSGDCITNAMKAHSVKIVQDRLGEASKLVAAAAAAEAAGRPVRTPRCWHVAFLKREGMPHPEAALVMDRMPGAPLSDYLSSRPAVTTEHQVLDGCELALEVRVSR